jgi:cation diffusion facilitator CzcD-associated flavoprotein CzcO
MNSDMPHLNSPSKRVTVIGAGAAGLVAIKILRSTLDFEGEEWKILYFERRHVPGGVW